jgi:cobalt/nickel transport system permease protein
VALAGLSIFASQNPDGLEWAVLNTAGTDGLQAGGGVAGALASIQERLSFMPGYDTGATGGSGAPAAGLMGAVLVFALALAAAFIIRGVKRGRKRTAEPSETRNAAETRNTQNARNA